MIREEEPPRPSTRLIASRRTAAGVAAQRQTEPAKLARLVRGELDWIVMKALEKDRDRRYETANGFAADVQRYLADEPVQACPPSAWYRLRKFARRNQAALATGGLLLFFLTVLGSGIGWVAWDLAAQQRETERGATAALAQADFFLAQGDQEIDNPARWQAMVGLAESSVQGAEAVLAVGRVTADLAKRMRRLRTAVTTARTDSNLLVELERIQLDKAAVQDGHFDSARAASLYAAVLRAYGIDLAAPEEAAARVRGSRVREALLSALEDWWRVTTDEAERRQVAAVLRAAEPAPDAFRKRWWAAMYRGDKGTLIQMVAEPGVQGLPPMAVVNMAEDLSVIKEYASAERLLRAAQERNRDNVWLNHDLGMLLLHQRPSRPEEAVPYLTAALALRSESSGVYLNLGNALLAKKDLKGAIREYQAALKINPDYLVAHNNLGVALRDQKDLEGAIRAYQAALRINPDYAEAHQNLGNALRDQKDLEGAVREYQAALKINPVFVEAYLELGNTLLDQKDPEGAIRAYQAALRINPDLAEAHNNLGLVLLQKKDPEGAIREFQAALRINPDYAEAHNNLGQALHAKKDLEGAGRAYQAALKIKPNLAEAHQNLGNALYDKKDLEGAIREYRAALEIDPNHSRTHYHLGNALRDQGDLEEAIRAYQAAIKINPNFASAHYNLGNALHDKKEIEGAIREYQAAIKIDPNNAAAHCNLGHAFWARGEFHKALEALRRGHELGSKDPRWSYPSAQWVKQGERLVTLDEQLPGFISGQETPASPSERIELAKLCSLKRLHRAAARFYEEALAEDPKLLDDLRAQHRYNAGCAAALAGCGQGTDADKLVEKEKARLRDQALGWFQADLALQVKKLAGGKPGDRAVIQATLQYWQIDPDLAGVRDEASLAKLPEVERWRWQKLWSDVAATLARPPEKD